jgi:hypothetical protein
MGDFLAYLFAEIWNHRRNRFIAVGGTAVFFICLMVLLKSIPETPKWLSDAVAFMCGLLILATLALMCYYIVKLFVMGTRRLWTVLRGTAKSDTPENFQRRGLPK